MEEYDFLVIGSGSGLDVANAAVDRGDAVAMADSGTVTLDDHDGHPSVRSLVDDDYEIITF